MITVFDNINAVDLNAIAALEQQIANGWTKAMIFEAFEGKTTQFIKAESEGSIVGFVSYCVVFEEAEINSVVVDRHFRRRGVATALLKHLEQLLKNGGAKSVFLEVNEHNLGAITLYESCGYKRIAERKNYYGTDSALVLKKEL